MTQLPYSPHLNIAALSAVFADTTNAYKFYWFLAILDHLRDTGTARVAMHDLALRMLGSVWYPLDYFKLSFGRRDTFKPIASFISQHVVVDNSPTAAPLFTQLQALPTDEQKQLQRWVRKLTNWVPYRFIRPMFVQETRALHDPKVNALIITLANASQRAPYRFDGKDLVLHKVWIEYLQQHQVILRGFIHWHLVRFLQKNNPNVTGLTEKLNKPSQRDLKTAGHFWKHYLKAHPALTCIYSGQPITLNSLSLDHFLPWSFVAHDQLWNIVPTPKTVNSTKNDWLPSFQHYFDPFAALQYSAFQFHAIREHYALLEDYLLLFARDIAALRQLSYSGFRDYLHGQLTPQLQIAQNLGFPHPFVYRGNA